MIVTRSSALSYASGSCPGSERGARVPSEPGSLARRCVAEPCGPPSCHRALGLVLNAIVLFTTRYLDAAITELRAGGYEVRDEDAARRSPFVRHHINMLGRYSFLTPELAGALRPLRDPSEPEDGEVN